VLTRIQDTPDADQNVKVLVASSQRNDCTSGSQVAVAVQDLQDMHNDFQAKISEGLGKLAENQGRTGLAHRSGGWFQTHPKRSGAARLDGRGRPEAQQDEATQAEKESRSLRKQQHDD